MSADKIARFTDTILKYAGKQKNDIIESALKNKKKVINETENQLLEEAYNTIQREIVKILKNKNEKLAKEILINKKYLLNKRQDIVDTFFENIENQMNNFIASAKYNEFLVENIKNAVKKAGEGALEVWLSYKDYNLRSSVLKDLDLKLVEKFEENGGCKVYNKTLGIIIDCTLKTKLKDLKSHFIETSGLVIEY